MTTALKRLIASADLSNPIDISIPLRFNGPQPNVYGVEPATSKPCETDEFVGDTRRGGSVNFEEYRFIPHCNGTHTECVGHITDKRISVRDCLKAGLSEALVISVESESAGDSTDSYPYGLEPSDRLISQDALKTKIAAILDQVAGTAASPGASRSLVIRTLPNDKSKREAQYDKNVPAFLSSEAARHIVECRFDHLLVDLPSIDRIYDGGAVSNHRIFWNVAPGVKAVNDNTRVDATVTELIYVPDQVEDGSYLLNLQIAPFDSDAAPSRPILYNLEGIR